MKLVILSHDGNCCGGAQKCLLDLLKGINTKYPSWQIYVIFPYDGDFIATCAPYISGYEIIKMRWWLSADDKKINMMNRVRYIKRMRRPVFKILRYLLSLRPDYGMTNTIVLPHLSVACKFLNISHAWFIHEVPTGTWSDNEFLFSSSVIFKLIDRLSDKILVPSKFAKTFYSGVIRHSDKLQVINQAVELESSLFNSYECMHDRYSILLVGAFDSNKGQLELLQAIKKIVDGGKDIYCYLVGLDVGMMSSCEKFISDNLLDANVLIVPFTEFIQKYYLLSDVLVVCSTLETFGRVVVEAQKCGLPVILSDVGANPERIKDGINGFLYRKGDVDDLVMKIELLRDKAMREKFSKNIDPDEMEEYNIITFATKFYELLE